MLSIAEITRAIIGGWRIARFDLNAVDLFGRTPQAAMRSCVVLLIVIPMMVASSWPSPETLQRVAELTPVTYAILAGLQLIITVLAFYLVVGHLTRRLGVGQRFAHYVCCQNWLSFPVWLVLIAIYATTDRMGLSETQAVWLRVVLQAALIMYSWVITVATLRLRHLAAFALCVMELLFGQFVQQIVGFILLLTLTTT
jgi:hypothetical protein